MNLWCLEILGFTAGAIAVFSGLGGGLVIVPGLALLAGADVKEAIAVSALANVAISCSAALGHLKRHVPNLRIVSFLEMFAVLGSALGAFITLKLGKDFLFGLFGFFFFATAVFLWNKINEEWVPRQSQDSVAKALGWEGSYYDALEKRSISYIGSRAIFSGFLMFLSGMMSALLGFGGNALVVLIHNRVIGLPPKVSLTMSNLVVGVIALAGANIYLEAGLINPRLVGGIIPGVVVGALVGSKFVASFSNRVTQLFLILMLFLVGVEMITSGLWRHS